MDDFKVGDRVVAREPGEMDPPNLFGQEYQDWMRRRIGNPEPWTVAGYSRYPGIVLLDHCNEWFDERRLKPYEEIKASSPLPGKKRINQIDGRTTDDSLWDNGLNLI